MVSKEFKYKASPTTNLKLFSFSDQNLMRVVEVWFDDWKKYFGEDMAELRKEKKIALQAASEKMQEEMDDELLAGVSVVTPTKKRSRAPRAS